MLPRPLRLSREGFEQVRGLSRTQTPHFFISHGKTAEYDGSAVIVPKKVCKSAVQRHLLKRRVRAILRPLSRKDYTLVVTARLGAQDRTFSELQNELSSALHAILAK